MGQFNNARIMSVNNHTGLEKLPYINGYLAYLSPRFDKFNLTPHLQEYLCKRVMLNSPIIAKLAI